MEAAAWASRMLDSEQSDHKPRNSSIIHAVNYVHAHPDLEENMGFVKLKLKSLCF